MKTPTARSTLLVLWILCVACFKYGASQVTCNKQGQPTCVCETPDGGKIDLTSLGNQDGTPRFSGIRGEFFQRYDYSYNPCYGFSTGTHGCSGAPIHAACQEETDIDDQYSCGLASTESFVYFGGSINNELHYDGGDAGRVSVVELICDLSAKSPILTAQDDDNFKYSFKLTTECACPGACKSAGNNGGKGGGVAPGEIGITILVLTPFGFAMYFVIGAIIMKFKFQKEGKEMIPNYKFWIDFPFLIKDGFMFVYQTIYKLIKRDKGGSDYDKL